MLALLGLSGEAEEGSDDEKSIYRFDTAQQQIAATLDLDVIASAGRAGDDEVFDLSASSACSAMRTWQRFADFERGTLRDGAGR